eukprot:s3243_g7.t1
MTTGRTRVPFVFCGLPSWPRARKAAQPAELVLQVFSLLASEMSLLDLPATARVVELTCMWTTQASCVQCQHHSTTEACTLHRSDAATTVSGLLQNAHEFEDVDDEATCPACCQETWESTKHCCFAS